MSNPLSYSLIRVGGANHFKGIEAVGGQLFLFDDRLEFKSHSFNIQNHTLMIMLPQIAEVSFYNTLGIIPNGLKVTKTDGTVEKFVVQKRRLWKELIEQTASKKS